MHMKFRPIARVLAALSLLLFSVAARGMEIVWDYDHGWTKGFVMTIDTDHKKVTILDRETDLTLTKDLINAENLGEYLSGLIKKVPETGLGEKSQDGVVNSLTVRNKGTSLDRTVYRINPPGAILLNEDYKAATANEEAAKFRKGVDGYLLVDMLFKVQAWYFGKEMAEKRAEKHIIQGNVPSLEAR